MQQLRRLEDGTKIVAANIMQTLSGGAAGSGLEEMVFMALNHWKMFYKKAFCPQFHLHPPTKSSYASKR